MTDTDHHTFTYSVPKLRQNCHSGTTGFPIFNVKVVMLIDTFIWSRRKTYNVYSIDSKADSIASEPIALFH